MTSGFDTQYESPELANFRAEWRAELESRKHARQASVSANNSNTSTATPEPSTSTRAEHTGDSFLYPIPRPHQKPRKATLDAESHPAITSDGRIIDEKRGKALTSALGVYKQAVQYEQAGDLDKALTSYRQAFRMVSCFMFDFSSWMQESISVEIDVN